MTTCLGFAAVSSRPSSCRRPLPASAAAAPRAGEHMTANSMILQAYICPSRFRLGLQFLGIVSAFRKET